MRVMIVVIETFSRAQRYEFEVNRATLSTFLINPRDIKFYRFDTLSGSNEAFLYSDIKHISFTEV